jgi:hypothetical protein
MHSGKTEIGRAIGDGQHGDAMVENPARRHKYKKDSAYRQEKLGRIVER